MPARRLLRFTLVAVACGTAACGSGGTGSVLATPAPKATATAAPGGATPTPDAVTGDEPVTRDEARVIRGWSDSLRHGDLVAASRYFALPSVVANGTPPSRIQTRAQAEQFNRALTCGATVVSLQRSVHHYVLAKFRLAERPGGNCGGGAGNLAWTAFQIRSGRIVQWLRVPEPPSAPTTPS
jgi:hypothetical protein